MSIVSCVLRLLDTIILFAFASGNLFFFLVDTEQEAMLVIKVLVQNQSSEFQAGKLVDILVALLLVLVTMGQGSIEAFQALLASLPVTNEMRWWLGVSPLTTGQLLPAVQP